MEGVKLQSKKHKTKPKKIKTKQKKKLPENDCFLDSSQFEGRPAATPEMIR